MSKIINLGVLVSGSGSNLQSIFDNIEKGNLPARIRISLSNNPGSFALERARNHGIPCAVIEHGGFVSRGDYDRKLVDTLRAHDGDLVVLAGVMRDGQSQMRILTHTSDDPYEENVLTFLGFIGEGRIPGPDAVGRLFFSTLQRDSAMFEL